MKRQIAGALAALALIAGLAGCSSSSPTGSPGPGTAGPGSSDPGTFSATGSMSVPRLSHVAALLPDGRVLIAGGYSSATQVLASAEIYDPASGTFTVTGSMAGARGGATATVLQDGRVLVVGGYEASASGNTIPLATAEIYDPATGSFSPAGALSTARYKQTATRLADGSVLLAGGTGRVGLDSAELYLPTSRAGSFVQTGTMTISRTGHVAALLGDGRVVLAGGTTADQPGSPSYLASAELYDPQAGTFAATGSMAQARYGATSATLASGRVLVCGGRGQAPDPASLATAELYDPASGTFSATGSMATPRSGPATALLSDGRVLLAGGLQLTGGQAGTYLATAELYLPGNGTFSPAATMAAARYGATATLLADGRVLIVGGGDSNATLASAEIYTP